MSTTHFEDFNYVDLNQVDPNDTPLPQDVYQLKVLKVQKATAASGRPYIKGSFAVVNHPSYSARRVFKNWFRLFKEDGSIDLSSTDFKNLRKLMDVTGVRQTGGFEKWLEDLSLQGPVFVAPVNQATRTQKTGEVDPQTGKAKYEAVTQINAVSGEVEEVKDNYIDFRNAQIA